MGQVLIRNVDDKTIESLKLKAEQKGHSLEQELRRHSQAGGRTDGGGAAGDDRSRRARCRRNQPRC